MTILLVGCGRMGGALAKNWVGTDRVLVHDSAAALPPGAEAVVDLRAMDGIGDMTVVLAVKPQAFPDVAAALAPVLAPLMASHPDRGPLLISVMAGIGIARLAQALDGNGRIVRAMPNTPAAIGRGITAAVAAGGVSSADRAVAERLLRATGECLWLDDEQDLHAVTALSGSGPAYFFRMTEALAAGGVSCGLSPVVARRLARATFAGAAALADADPSPLAVLREQVTSPGGTTAAGLRAMEADGRIDMLMRHVVEAAAHRSCELASGKRG